MAIVFWDASALAKYYSEETGSDTVEAVFSHTPRPRMVETVIGYAETFSILVRHRNRGTITNSTFTDAMTLLRQEIVGNPDFVLLTVEDDAIFGGIALMERYSINATDASILVQLLRYLDAQPYPPPGCLLVAADKALLKAATSEGLLTLNPETVAAVDVPTILARL